MFAVKLSLENRKAIVTFLLDTSSQTDAVLPAWAGEQVLSWNKEVVEFTTFQMVNKVFEEKLKTVA